MILKTCFGCATGGCILSHNSIKKAKVCPCIDCIVKVSCLDPCKNYLNLLDSMYPPDGTPRKNYKANRVERVFFPVPYGRHDSSDLTVKKGYLAAGSKITDLRGKDPTVNYVTLCRPSNCSWSSVYLEEKDVIYINK